MRKPVDVSLPAPLEERLRSAFLVKRNIFDVKALISFTVSAAYARGDLFTMDTDREDVGQLLQGDRVRVQMRLPTEVVSSLDGLAKQKKTDRNSLLCAVLACVALDDWAVTPFAEAP